MSKITIIAEAGVNHNGDIDLAKELIDKAVAAKVDYIKFQTFKTELNIAKHAHKASYQIANCDNKTETQFEMGKKLELSFEEFVILKRYCDSQNIGFLSTGFDLESIDFLDTLGMPFFKIPSGEITNKPYLEHIAKKGKDVVLSTGMANMEEIADALNVLESNGLIRSQITILHCNTEYPTPMQDVNLLAMNHIKQVFGVKIGYSDHTKGIEVPIAAAALGASVIEKHFTLDRNLPGPDHKASLEPDELIEMVIGIRNIELAISGDGIKAPSSSEKDNINIARKSLHYSCDFKKGHVLKPEDIKIIRPGSGLSPMNYDYFINRMLIKDVLMEQIVQKEDVK
ncbi:MAG: N-acetylneuraminate synthase [Bacteroidetes bacterium]|nr:N-acetylneuraminate synthase [Bacteroidota bacterium]